MCQTSRKKSKLDVVWMDMKDKVKDVVNEIMKEKGGTKEATSNEIFRNRTCVAHRVYNELTMDEKSAIDKKIMDGTDSIPHEIQQQSVYMSFFVISKSQK